MNLVNRVELKLEKFDKCHLTSDNDCPLGVLYDYSCALQSFILQKMQEAKAAQDAHLKEEQVKSE